MSVEKVKTPGITWLKEIVTAGLGILVVAGIFWLLWPQLTKPTPDIQTAQAIFSILGGWGGVVLGYYFGRLPAERAATRAEAAASAAETAKDDAITKRKTTLAKYEDKVSEMEESLETYMKLIGDLRKRIDEL